MDPVLAETVFDTIRRSLGLSVGVVQFAPEGGESEWRLDARDASGEVWIVAHPEYAGAVLLLAEAVAIDLRE